MRRIAGRPAARGFVCCCRTIAWTAAALAVSLIAQTHLVDAASQSFSSLAGLTTKGIVVARTPDSLTVADGSRSYRFTVTGETQVRGFRTSFDQIVPNDLVRVNGLVAGDQLFVAARIEVLLAARNGATAQQRRTTLADTLLSWILKGGIVVTAP